MQRRDIRLLVLIVLVTAFAAWVAWPGNPGIHLRIGDRTIDREIDTQLGLDLRGGMQVLLEAALPEGSQIDPDSMEAAVSIVESRVNALGVTEPVVQSVGSRRILVELPGIQDPEEAIETLRETGLMEWVDTGNTPFQAGETITTDFAQEDVDAEGTEQVFPTILTGRNLRDTQVQLDPQTGQPLIQFELDSEGADIFAEHTRNNIGEFLCITLDKTVISCPVINSAIPGGSGVIQGRFTLEEARAMVLQLKYGALPIPLEVVDTRAVGPTLGEESVDKSVRAGGIGLAIVLLFMLIYYRLPGFLADVALIIYALLTLAAFKLIPVTLTLPGIAGFLLSVGMAVDANILIFERMREELRQGRTLQRSITEGFRQAWRAIFESNMSVWIICLILWFFGNSFGASMVKGFAVTLAIGVFVSMFTAVTVTRTLIHSAFAVAGEDLREKHWLLGI